VLGSKPTTHEQASRPQPDADEYLDLVEDIESLLEAQAAGTLDLSPAFERLLFDVLDLGRLPVLGEQVVAT